jgi:riboflavin synthase
MFTGIIETVGTLERVEDRDNYRILSIRSDLPTDEIVLGESIACDGACLTVTDTTRNAFAVEASQETVARTIVEGYRQGSRIHLERGLKVGSRLGGHFVSGHVDDRGEIDSSRMIGQSREIAVRFDSRFDPLVIEKGSIAINGVSLTINEVRSGWMSVNIIPYTLDETTLGDLAPGHRVNLEFDLIGKYVLKSGLLKEKKTLTIDKLIESGW